MLFSLQTVRIDYGESDQMKTVQGEREDNYICLSDQMETVQRERR